MEMASAVSKAKTMRVKNDKMSLEDYLLLLHSHSHLHLTVVHLNQLISMHGYKKIHKVPKQNRIDAVSTLNLVDPSRSTLKDYISPLVITTLDDVIADLNELNWQECCVTSIETLNSWKHAVVSSSPAPPPLASPRTNDAVRNRKTLDPRSNGVVSSPKGASPPCLASEITADHPAKKLVPRKKRKRSAKHPGAGGGGGGANHRALDCVSYGSTSS